jgi:hypothetical protein
MVITIAWNPDHDQPGIIDHHRPESAGSLGEVETRRGEGGNNFILHRFLDRSTSPSSSAKPKQANPVSSPQPQKAPKNEALKRAGEKGKL